MRPQGPYTDWLWPPSPIDAQGVGGFVDLVHVLTPLSDPGPGSCIFWAHQFRTVSGEGGYVGLQTWGNRADGSIGKMAIFSLWDATEARGPGVVRFGGEGTGWSCRLPLPWEEGRGYRFEVAEADSDEDSAWWAALVDGEELGRIRTPRRWGRLQSRSVMWTEYYGPSVRHCDDLPHAVAVFSEPTAHGGQLRPRQRHHHVGPGECGNTRVLDVEGGVRQELGIPSRRKD